MERLVTAAKTVRNNWKKTVVFTAAAGYGVQWYNKKQQDNALLALCAREALNYGSQTQGVKDQNYHVTVILNPAASGGKGRKMFEQYCAPLLHLAGLKVSVQLTAGREEAKQLMKIMENTDAVLVAGGDGTLMEAVTGLMRRDDPEYWSKVPFGVLPVGENNTFAHRLFPGSDQVRQLTEATMAVIKQLRKRVSVMEVENMCENAEYRGKKVFGLTGIEMGAFREAYNRKENYWWLGGLKHRLSYIFSYLTAHKEINWEWPLKLNYTVVEEVRREVEVQPRGMLARFSAPKVVEKVERKEEWAEETQDTVSQIEIKVDDELNDLKVTTYPTNLTFNEFVGHGISRLQGAESELNPKTSLRTTTVNIDTETSEDTPRCMSVDGEEVELLGPIRVRLLPDRLVVFCRPEDAPATAGPQAPAGPSSRWSNVGVSSSLLAARQRL